ncbi:flavodoxin family protein [Wenzhouxiangella sp. XN79A]|uniref:NAD(P)H-dependent oxidoreductase n=1 Tax=Wenzhouxiangella sp. XN79A TaxID=2724193 RepID=UPI00144A692B|nr:flavodoxin family protein [Wenzhouxiangella sp. XN79A]
MAQLLVMAHAPSPNLERLRDAALDGARDPSIEGVDVVAKAPLDAGPDEVRAADAVLLLTPENLGYMSGALKDFFDRSFYELLDRTDALPYAVLVRAGQDGTGTKRALESICGGLKWRAVQDPLICRGPWQDAFEAQARDLGATLAAGLAAGIF